MGTRGAEVTHYFLPTCQITLPTHPHASPLTERSIFYINSIQKEILSGKMGELVQIIQPNTYIPRSASSKDTISPISWKLVERVRIA